LAPDRRKYLELQRALGGKEVILSKPLTESLRGAERPDESREKSPRPLPGPRDAALPAPSEPRALDAAPPAPPQPREEQGAGPAKKHWSVDAPPIPTLPGIIVPVRERSLMEGEQVWENLDEVARVIAGCTKCFLSQNRKNPVPGEGNPNARLMFVGEGPGQTEDETGRPFVGKAGELLTRMIEAIGLKREDVYIANVVKNRPPQNRKPLPDEIIACMPYLERQIELIRPRVLVALGATAAEALLSARQSLTNLRGRVHSFRGTPLVVTYHPAALLRNPNWKKPTWDDVRIARQLLDR
jgi:uracil-DNA glycosylase family 4